MLLILCLVAVNWLSVTDAGFTTEPITSIYEDDNAAKTIYSISATCPKKYIAYFSRSHRATYCCNDDDCTCRTIQYREESEYRSTTAACTSCSLSTNPDSNLFYYDNFQVKRYACADPNCRTCSAQGCFNYDTKNSYYFVVTCWHSSWSSNTITKGFTVTITENTAPVFISGDFSVGVVGASVRVYDPTVTDKENDASYYFDPAPGAAFLTGNNLWSIDAANGDISTTMSLSMEYSQYFNFTMCANDRRNTVCKAMTLTLTSCFQIPTCYNASNLNVWDTHAVGGTLFNVMYPNPTLHFPYWSAAWQGLAFSIDDADTLPVTIDNTGHLTSTGNITVHPSYPYEDYFIVVRIANSASCGRETTCTMTLHIYFTNWDIEIRSLRTGELEYNASASLHEDTDPKTPVHHLITYDYNNAAHDNVTCWISRNDDSSLLALELSAAGDRTIVSPHEVYTIYKLECGEYECGFDCDYNMGCMNYDKIDTYTVDITCEDGYGSQDTQTFTFNVLPNEPPVFTNWPSKIILDGDTTAQHDIIHKFSYTDAEQELLYFNCSFTPATEIFQCDPFGNYSNNQANLSLTTFNWDEAANLTFDIYICGTERRNIVCHTITVEINSNCGDPPTCSDNSNTISDQFGSGGTIFTVTKTNPAGGTLSYSVSPPDKFDISSTGVITTKVTFSPGIGGETHSILVTLRDSLACQYATCSFTLTVTYTNFPISIDNLPATVSIHEDTTVAKTLITLTTSDANSGDTVTCSINDAASTPANTGKFETKETFTGSNVWNVLSKDGGLFDYSAQSTYTVNVKCEDASGSPDDGDLTVNIEENVIQTFVGLDPAAGKALQFDLTTLSTGAVLYTVQTTDTEGDSITYSCTVANSMVPLYCNSTGEIYLRRTVAESEKDTTYQITMMATDSIHSYTISIVFSITFVVENTKPVITAPPTDLVFAENDAIVSPLYTVVVTDPDSADTITVSMVTDPAESSSMFSLDPSTFQLTLVSGNTFDYETRTSYTFTFNASDGHSVAEQTQSLTISVSDVNEAPSFTLTSTAISVAEGPPMVTLYTLQYTCTDVDANDNVHLSLVSSSLFNLNPTTAELSYSAEWDLEAGDPTTASLTVACSDTAGLSQQATLQVTITRVNEFSPVPSETTVSLNISTNTAITDVLYTISVTDQDYGDDGVFVFNIIGIGYGVKYFTIDSAGRLRIKEAISLTYNRVFQFTVKISDGETSPLYGYVAFTVTYNTTYEPETPQRETKCTTCTTEGKVVIAVFAVEGVIILGALLHLIIHFARGHLAPPAKVSSSMPVNTTLNFDRAANANNAVNNNSNSNNNNNDNQRQRDDRDDESDRDESGSDSESESISSLSEQSDIEQALTPEVDQGLPDAIYAHQHVQMPSLPPEFSNPVYAGNI